METTEIIQSIRELGHNVIIITRCEWEKEAVEFCTVNNKESLANQLYFFINIWEFLSKYFVYDMYQLMETDTDFYITLAHETVGECKNGKPKNIISSHQVKKPK